MRVAVIGATGNLGMAAVHSLLADERVEEIVGIARRRPDVELAKVRWVAHDVLAGGLASHLAGADVAVHLAWAIQPSRDQDLVRRTNIDGSRRVLDALAQARVPALVYASSVGAYAPGPKDRAVDERWPVQAIASSHYARHKVAVERILDRFEREREGVRVVRLRPALVFGRAPGAEIRRYFAGPLLPGRLLRPGRIPVVPKLPRLRFQVVHRADVGEAIRLAALAGEHGAFNLATDPVLDAPRLARLLDARCVPMPATVARAAAAATWRLRLQPTPPGWLDLALGVPIMSTARARDRLGWAPTRGAEDTLLELLAAIREGSGGPTPPLAPDGGIRRRVAELGRELAGGSR